MFKLKLERSQTEIFFFFKKATESKTENTEYKTKDHDIKTQSTMQVSVTEDKSQGGDPQKKEATGQAG